MSGIGSGSGLRETWGSRAAFVLAAAGSAVGLGNIWRFPTTTGQNGGAAFVAVYLACVLLIGLPVMLCELLVGRRSQRNPVGAFETLAPRSSWRLVGGMGVITGVVILSYYSVVAGWTLGYAFKIITGIGASGSSTTGAAEEFGAFVGHGPTTVFCLALFLALTVAVVIGGVRAGIERWSKILMPALFIMLVVLVVRSLTLEGAAEGLRFYLQPDFSLIHANTVISAMGQAFFSLSIGMGAMITYGSYLSKKEDLVRSALWVLLADTSVALLAGFAIFPALFTVEGLQPTEGAGLIFVVLPRVFDTIPLGRVFGGTFFLLIVIAALTSTVSLLEVVTAYLVDERRWSRRKATISTGLFCFLLGVPSALSTGASTTLSQLYHQDGQWKGFLDLVDMIFGNIMLMLGGLLLAVFVGWRLGLATSREEIEAGHGRFGLFPTWLILVKYVCPVAMIALLVQFLWMTLRAFG